MIHWSVAGSHYVEPWAVYTPVKCHRYFDRKSGHQWNHWNPSSFVFGLICNFIGDLAAKFRIAVSEFMYGSLTCCLNLENSSETLIALKGVGSPPTDSWWQDPSIPVRGAGWKLLCIALRFFLASQRYVSICLYPHAICIQVRVCFSRNMSRMQIN